MIITHHKNEHNAKFYESIQNLTSALLLIGYMSFVGNERSELPGTRNPINSLPKVHYMPASPLYEKKRLEVKK